MKKPIIASMKRKWVLKKRRIPPRKIFTRKRKRSNGKRNFIKPLRKR